MKKFLLAFLCLLAVGISPGWAADVVGSPDVTWVAKDASDNPGDEKVWTRGVIDEYTSWSATKGGTNDPKYYANGESLRVYKGGAFTITSSKNIASITLTFQGTSYTFSSSDTSNPQTVNLGTNTKSYTWDATRAGRVKKVEIVYATGTVTPTTYTVTLNPGNGTVSGSTTLTEASAGAGVTLPSATCNVSDWEFAGWSTSSVSSTTSAPTLIPPGTYTPDSNITLYAVYKKTETSGSGTSVTKSLTNSEIEAARSKTGYASGYVTGATIESAGGNWTGNCAFNKYSGSYSVQINKNNSNYHLASPAYGGLVSSITIDTQGNASTAANRKFYICSSNSTAQPTSGDLGEGAITVNNGSVTINLNGAANSFYIYSDGTAYIHHIDVTYGGASSTTTYNSNPSGTVTPPTPVPHTIIYQPNGGTGQFFTDNFEEGDNATIKSVGTEAGQLNYTKEGYTFSKWTTAEDGTGDVYNPGDVITNISANYVLYAQWTPVYTVTYNANGGSGTMTDSSSPYTAGATVTVLPCSFTREGYTFSKWNTEADGSGNDYAAGATFTINANTILYAQWTENPVTPPVNPGTAGTYTLVTSQDQIAAGYEYVICAATSDYLIGTKSSKNYTGVEFSQLDGVITTLPADAKVIKLHNAESTGNFDMQLMSDSKYLAATGDSSNGSGNNNELKPVDEAGSTTAVSIVYNDDHVKITFVNATGKTGKYLRYNGQGSNHVFSAYVTEKMESGYENLRLFRKVVSETEPLPAVFSKTGQLIGDGDNKDNHTVTVTSQKATEIHYTINGGAEQTLSATDGVATLPPITEACTIEAWGVNTSTSETGVHSSADFTVVYLPEITFNPAGDMNATFRGGQKVTISVTNDPTIFQYSVDDGATWTDITSGFQYTLTDDTELLAYAVNAAGSMTSDEQDYIMLRSEVMPTFSIANGSSINYGDLVTITCNDTNVDQIKYQLYNGELELVKEDIVDVDPATHSITIPIQQSGEVMLQAWGVVSSIVANDTYSGTVTYTVAEPVNVVYRKVLDDEDLIDGAKYIIVTAKTVKDGENYVYKAMTGIGSGNSETVAVGENNKIELNQLSTQVMPFKLIAKADGKYALEAADFNAEHVGEYLSVAVSGDNATVSYSTDANDPNILLTVDPTETKTRLLYADPFSIQYNRGNFNAYKSTQSAVQLYIDDSNAATAKRVKISAKLPAQDEGYYNNSVMVTMLSNTADAKIMYKLGETGEWQTYNKSGNGVNITEPTVIYAKAVMEDNSLPESTVTELEVKFRPAVPVINVESVGTSKSVIITSATTGASIYYTLDGGEPQLYSGALKLTELNRTYQLEAYAVKNEYNPSTSASVAQSVTVELAGDEHELHVYESNTLGFAWKSNQDDADLNGVTWHLETNPVDAYRGAASENPGMQIGSNSKPVNTATVTTTEIPGEISKVTVVTYGQSGGTVKVLVGDDHDTATEFGTIEYGAIMETYSVEGTGSGKIWLEFTNPGKALYIEEICVNYTPIPNESIVKRPVFSVTKNYVEAGRKVRLSSPTEGASIYYTLDGSEPTTSSTLYSDESPIVINEGVTVNARAFKDGMTQSIVASHEYMIGVPDYYELVKAGEKLYENDRIILVNAVPWPDGGNTYFYMTDEADMAHGYWNVNEVDNELILERDKETNIPSKIAILHNENPGVMVLEYDGESFGEEDDAHWLLRAYSGVYEGKYLRATGKKKFDFVELPPMDQRKGMSARAYVTDAVLDANDDKSGDFHNYSSASEGGIADRITINNKAVFTFSGTDEVVIRFNPKGANKHFNCYGYLDENLNVALHQSTYPVRIYRANPVLAPSMTITPKVVKPDVDDTGLFDDEHPIDMNVTTYYNPVKIKIAENPRTREGAELEFAWSKDEDTAPVASEYTKINGTADVKGVAAYMYVDGFNGWYYDLGEDGEPDLNARHDIDLRDYMDTTNPLNYFSGALRVISHLSVVENGKHQEYFSRSTAHTFNFETTAPVVTKGTKIVDIDGVETEIKGVYVTRPKVYTKGAKTFYTICTDDDDVDPVVTYDENGVPSKGNARTSQVGFDGTSDDNFIPVPAGSYVKIGAFREGYKTRIQVNGNYSVTPEARAVQLLLLNNSGVEHIATVSEHKSTLSDADITGLGLKRENGEIVNDPNVKTYLTYRTVDTNYGDDKTPATGKYYMLRYGEENGEMKIYMADVNDDAAKEVIANPHMFKWTADYFVFCMDKIRFNETVPHEKYVENSGKLKVYDGSETNVVNGKFITLSINENLDDDEYSSEPYQQTYLGAVLNRKGSLGTNYVWVDFEYKVREREDADPVTYTNSAITEITPMISLPFSLEHHYELVRDESSLWDATSDYEFETASSIAGQGPVAMKFDKDQFTLRRLDCVFSFHRPNVCDDIIDHYHIVYDIDVKTVKHGDVINGLPANEDEVVIYSQKRWIDPLTSDQIQNKEAEYGDDEHDNAHRYEFRINDVHPNEDIYPSLEIKSVTFIPNNEDGSYAQFPANYAGVNPGTEATVDSKWSYAQKIGDTSTKNSASIWPDDVNFVVQQVQEEDETYSWKIYSHECAANEPTIGYDNNQHSIEVEAPFMYHVESVYEGSDAAEGGNHYTSCEYLIQHDYNHHHANGLDNLIVAKGYKSVENLPTLYITPVYFFSHNPTPNVDNCHALEDYEIFHEEPVMAPANKAPMRAPETDDVTPSPVPDDKNIVIVRGSNVLKVTPKWLYTGIQGVGDDASQIRQDGNDLVLPNGAKLFDLNGLQIEPKALMPGVYIVKLANGASLKVAVK